MPIPGPPAPTYVAPVNETGSPFWLSLNGVWLQVEGIAPAASVGVDRPRSALVSMDGNRFEQRARMARRSWSWSMPWATAAHLAAVRAAADSDGDVWLMVDPVGVSNMLPARSCFGPELPAIDCGGVPLGSFDAGTVVTGRVRGGVATTLACWSDLAAAAVALDVTYPGGSIAVDSLGGGQAAETFTPTVDGVVTIEVSADTTGLMLTEGTPEETFVAGESMPCKVVIDDPEDVLRMQYQGNWTHDYTIALREVG